MTLTFDTAYAGEEAVARLSGSLSHADHERFRGLLSHVSDTRPPRYVLDLTALESIDSAGLGMLLMAREAAGGDGRLVLRRPGGQVLRMLRLVEFHHLFPVE